MILWKLWGYSRERCDPESAGEMVKGENIATSRKVDPSIMRSVRFESESKSDGVW